MFSLGPLDRDGAGGVSDEELAIIVYSTALFCPWIYMSVTYGIGCYCSLVFCLGLGPLPSPSVCPRDVTLNFNIIMYETREKPKVVQFSRKTFETFSYFKIQFVELCVYIEKLMPLYVCKNLNFYLGKSDVYCITKAYSV